MKAKYLFICAALALPLFVSCNDDKKDQPGKTNYQEMTFTASIPDAGTVSCGWKAGDAISIFDGKANQKFVTSDNGSSASFSGSANASAKEFMAVTPYDKALSRKSGKVTLSIPSSQTVVPGSFDPALNRAVAYTTGKELKFVNIPAYVRLELNAGGYNVVSVAVEAVGGEQLSGDVTVALTAAPTVETTGASNKVMLSGESFEGAIYAVVVPSTLSQGLKVALTDENDSRAEVVISNATLKMGEVTDLGTVSPTEWKESTNPNPTQVSGAVVLAAAFKAADFNLINDPGFEDYPNDCWLPTSATTVTQIDGYNSPKAIRIERAGANTTMTNFEQGCKWQMGTVNTRWIMEFDARVSSNIMAYSGFGFFDAYGCWWKEAHWEYDGSDAPTENGRVFFKDEAWHHYIIDDECYMGQYKGEVHVGMWGDDASWAEYDNLIAYPYGYEYKGTSTEPAGTQILGRVTNATFDEVDALGKVLGWVDQNNQVKLAFSNVTINGVKYPSAIAETATDGTTKLEITKFYKSAGKVKDIVPLAAGQLSMVPDDIFVMNDKTYMHYYTTVAEGLEDNPDATFAWAADASGFAVSEDNGLTWTPASKMWAGSVWANNQDGKFSTATFVNREGYTYMVGSYAGRDNWFWGQSYGARIADGGDITDPDAYEYWTNNPPAGAWATGGEAAINDTACLMQGDRGVNDMIWNPKFNVYQLFYRADRVNGILYRDSKGPDANGNWYWSGAKLLFKDADTGVLGSVSVLKVNEDGSVVLLGSQL